MSPDLQYDQAFAELIKALTLKTIKENSGRLSAIQIAVVVGHELVEASKEIVQKTLREGIERGGIVLGKGLRPALVQQDSISPE